MASILEYTPKAKDLSHPANQLQFLTVLQTDSDLCFVWDTFASHPLVNQILFYEFITMLFKYIFKKLFPIMVLDFSILCVHTPWQNCILAQTLFVHECQERPHFP